MSRRVTGRAAAAQPGTSSSDRISPRHHLANCIIIITAALRPASTDAAGRGRRRKLELSLEMHPFERVIRIIIISMEKKGSGLRAWLARDIIFILTVESADSG